MCTSLEWTQGFFYFLFFLKVRQAADATTDFANVETLLREGRRVSVFDSTSIKVPEIFSGFF